MQHTTFSGRYITVRAFLAALCFSASAQAAESTFVSQASLSLSGLTFELIDIAPADGIAPSLTFQTLGLIDSNHMVYDETTDTYVHAGPQFSDGLLPATPINYVTADGQTSIATTSSGVTLQNQLPLSHIVTQLTPPNSDGIGNHIDAWTETSGDFAVGNFQNGELQHFTLSAGTSMVVRGTLSANLTLDSTGAQAALAANGYDWGAIYSNTFAEASFIMAADLELPSEGLAVLSGSQVNGIFVTLDGGLSASTSYEGGESFLEKATSRDFEFIITNLGTSDLTGVLALNLSVRSEASIFAERAAIDLPPIDVPAIPEPSTYALMGLGLVGILGATRRRRHTV